MHMHTDATQRRVVTYQQQTQQAQAIKQLQRRWQLFPIPVQEMLKLHLHLYGLSSAQDATDILVRLCKAEAAKGQHES